HFLNLAFVPFVLALIDLLRPRIFSKTYTISREPIDADELYSKRFEEVISKCVAFKTKKYKKFVIFIDNLDRLNNDRIIEALEALKTFMGSKYCIFVIAADDNVIRAVIDNLSFGNATKKYPELQNNNVGKRFSEDYLDKFFQQTFRLPEFMITNLQEFALKNFSTTKLYDKLQSKGGIKNLISIILPSDVNSPRKIKRLLNEFIALYEIVEKRENQIGRQLWPGLLTGEPEFLGKFSTIRAEYPEFYLALTKNPEFLATITNQLQNRNADEALDNLTKELKNTNCDSLVSYLSKTQNITVEDIYPYIWLSQDVSSLGLQRDHYRLLKLALSNNNVSQIQSLIESSENKEYSRNIIRAGLGLVEQEIQLSGIELQNGVKVLAQMLTEIEVEIRPEVAHVLTKKIPQWPLSDFSAFEVLTVLRWAKRDSKQHKASLVNQLLRRLDDNELRQETFKAILDNYNVIETIEVGSKVQSWLEKLLSPGNQALGSPDVTQNKSNNEFAEWVIQQVPNYSDIDFVIGEFFSQSLVNYMDARIRGGINSVPTVRLDDDGLGQQIEKAYDCIGEYIKRGGKSQEFWNAIRSLMESTKNIYEYQFASKKIRELFDVMPQTHIVKFIVAIITGIFNLYSAIIENVNGWCVNEIGFIYYLQRNHKEAYSTEEAEAIQTAFTKLFSINDLVDKLLDFVETFVTEFGNELSKPFIDGLVKAFGDKYLDLESGKEIIRKLVQINNHLDDEQRNSIVEQLNNIVTSNDQNHILFIIDYFDLLKDTKEYANIFTRYSESWINEIKNEAVPLLKTKLTLASQMIQKDFLSTDIFVEKIILLIPFGGDPQKIGSVLDSLKSIKEDLSNDQEKKLFDTIITNIHQFGDSIVKALDLISGWLKYGDPSNKLTFSENLLNNIITSPNECLSILSRTWEYIPEDAIQRHLIKIYSISNSEKLEEELHDNTRKALNQVSKPKKMELIKEAWKEIAALGQIGDNFISTSVKMLDAEELLKMRSEAINSIIELRSANPDSEINLRFITNSYLPILGEKKSVVDLLENLFEDGTEDIKLANKYVVQCVEPMKLYSELKHALAKKMANAAKRVDAELAQSIKENARILKMGPGSWSYKKDWEI
nr:hypothetical protein [Asgard group archaeon]